LSTIKKTAKLKVKEKINLSVNQLQANDNDERLRDALYGKELSLGEL